MSTNDILIVPCDVSVINRIGKFTLNISNLIIKLSADIIVSLFDIDNKYISTITLPLVGEDYENWGSDDDYLISYVCNKLGFQSRPSNEETKV